MIGQTISHYKILEKLGSGGMGVVYKAEDTKLKRTVALKFLPPVFSFDKEAKQRFINEAQAASALQQHNICTIHEINETQDGQLFIVMDYYEGQTLGDKLKKSKLRLEEFFSISTQIAEGISWAHKIGIIHRDIKPANIFITKDGVVKILDFGLAKLTGQSMMTKMGSTVGTVAYMSPEQARGEDVDHRTDIWSFGVVMYEMLTGKPPFNSEYEQAMIYSILNEEIKPISSIKPDINPELDTLIMDCLEKDPNERSQSVAEIRRKLKLLSSTTSSSKIKSVSKAKEVLLQTGKETSIRESFSKKWKWLTIPLIILMAVVIIALIILQLSKPLEVDLSKYKFTPIATDAEPEWGATWSPDGSSIAYLKTVNSYDQIFIRKLDNPLPTQITFLENQDVFKAFWSPDGNLIYFISNAILYSIGLTGGEPKKIIDTVNGGASISPDSKTIAYWRFEYLGKNDSTMSDNYQRFIYIYSLIDGTNRKYNSLPFGIYGRYIPSIINFSPDGKTIGVTMWGHEAKNVEFWLLPWPDGEKSSVRRIFVTQELSWPSAFSWFPDSRNIILSLGVRANNLDLGIGDTKNEKIYPLISAFPGEFYSGSISPDGMKILVTKFYENNDIISIPLDGTQSKSLIATSRNESSLSFSKDGNKSTYITNKSGYDEIWLRKNDEDIRPIVSKKDFPEINDFEIGNAEISPDGKLIAFRVYSKEISSKVFLVPTTGGKPTRLLSGERYENVFSWSTDSKFLIFLINDVVAQIKVGAQELPIILTNSRVDENIVSALYSPDGQWIAMHDENRIILIKPDGKTKRVISKPSQISKFSGVLWSIDSSRLYIIDGSNQDLYYNFKVYAINIYSETCILLAKYKFDFLVGSDFSLSQDGKSIIATASESKSDIWILEGFPQP